MKTSKELVHDMLAKSEFRMGAVFDKCCVLHAKLPNGYILSEAMSVPDPDRGMTLEELKEECEGRMVDSLTDLIAFARHQNAYEKEQVKQFNEEADRLLEMANDETDQDLTDDRRDKIREEAKDLLKKAQLTGKGI